MVLMDLQEFNFMPLDERAAIALKLGTFLGVRISEEYSLVLYHLGKFFCEVWYCAENNDIVLVHGFKSKTLLEPYLELIELPLL